MAIRWASMLGIALSMAALPLQATAADARGVSLGDAPVPAAITVVDDSGAAVSLDRPARRIVTLAPSLTEFVYAVGAGDAMVGTVDSSDFPAAARQVPRVGDHQRLDIERIVGLKPDLVFVWQHGNSGREVAQLEALGLRLFRLEPRRLDEVAAAIRKVGRLTGHEAAAGERADRLRVELAALRRSHAAAAPVRVFYQAWSRPLMTLGGGQLTNDVIELCGGRNVFGALAAAAATVSTEAVVAARPEAMLATHPSAQAVPRGGGVARDPASGSSGVAPVDGATMTAIESRDATASAPPRTSSSVWRAPSDSSFATWTAFASIPAVARGWMFLLPADELVRAGPRIAEGARDVCEALEVVRAERR